jgi:HemY protein
MIRFLAMVVVALALGASAAYYLHADAGYVQIAWRSWLVQTSLLGFVLAVLLGSTALYYGARLLLASVRLPSILRGAMSERRARRARASFEKGLEQLLEGRWRAAEVELIRRAADHPARGLNYLFAAQAAERLGAPDRAARYLQQAGEFLPVAASLARAQIAHASKDTPGARQLLLRLHEADPRHEAAIEQLAAVHEQASDWEALDVLAASKETEKALPAERVRAWQMRIGHGRLGEALTHGRLDQLKKAWDAIPMALRRTPELRQRFVAGLITLNAEAEAVAQINAGLAEGWEPELARLYGDLRGIDALVQLAAAEQWLVQFGEKPELLWVAAIACRRNKLWGKARSYLEGLVRLAPSAKAYLELAQICQQMQQPEDSARYYRLGLEHAAGSAPQ